MISKPLHFETTNLLPGLYIVATPIGNLQDITLRALSTLQGADIVLAEDTRHTQKLLRAYDMRVAQLVCYNEHNHHKQQDRILAWAKDKAVVLVSDAGTPLIADPGYRLVAACVAAGVRVTSVPGPCAFVAAVTMAGLPNTEITFGGFVPRTGGKRIDFFRRYATHTGSVACYETPHRLLDTLDCLQDLNPERPLAVIKEISKTFETVWHGTAASCHKLLQDNPSAIKGEFVLVLGPCDKSETINYTNRLKKLLQDYSIKEAVRIICDETGLKKNDVYKQALALK